ncbi:MAG: nitroreductase family protein [Crenarchaeota archaeon]|nr:nitroreductase family protein [Thermoproteota archaeon]
MSEKQCIDFLLSRRSIRVFEDRDVPTDLLLKAIDVARYAPSARNSQPWRFYIVKRRDILDKLSAIHGGATPLRRAKAAIIVTSVPSESPASHQVDAALAAMYLWLALHCLGLGAVWIQTLRNVEEVRSIAGIPSSEVPIAILAVGWPAEKPSPKPRKPLESVVKIVE